MDLSAQVGRILKGEMVISTETPKMSTTHPPKWLESISVMFTIERIEFQPTSGANLPAHPPKFE